VRALLRNLRKKDPYTPSFAGPFSTIIVKVTDLCPLGGNVDWCEQTQANPLNEHGQPVHFDLCSDTGAAAAFPSGTSYLSDE
jgi:EXPB1-like domain 1